MNRRGFLGFLGLGAAASTVKHSVTLPETPDAVEKFAGGVLKSEPFYETVAPIGMAGVGDFVPGQFAVPQNPSRVTMSGLARAYAPEY